MRLRLWRILLFAVVIVSLALLIFHKQSQVSNEISITPEPVIARRSSMPTLKKTPARIVKSVKSVAADSEAPKKDGISEEGKKYLEWLMRDCSTISYDDNGDELVRQTDFGCDGSLDECSIKEFDESGAEISYRDEKCDGSIDKCNVVVRDEHDNVLRYITDDGCDGSDDRTICMSYTYDVEGRKKTLYSDFSCDGKTLTCASYEYDASGFLIKSKFDRGCDGNVHACRYLKNDDRGNVLGRTWDDGCDGTADSCTVSIYNDFDKRILSKRDEGCDGKADQCDYYIYDEDGFLTETRGDPGCKKLKDWEARVIH